MLWVYHRLRYVEACHFPQREEAAYRFLSLACLSLLSLAVWLLPQHVVLQRIQQQLLAQRGPRRHLGLGDLTTIELLNNPVLLHI